MTLEEEKALLARFAKAAGAGKMLNIHDLKAAYEKAIWHETSKSTIYNLLARHGWQKLSAMQEAIDKSAHVEDAVAELAAEALRSGKDISERSPACSATPTIHALVDTEGPVSCLRSRQPAAGLLGPTRRSAPKCSSEIVRVVKRQLSWIDSRRLNSARRQSIMVSRSTAAVQCFCT
jgi:hypothetical protein